MKNFLAILIVVLTISIPLYLILMMIAAKVRRKTTRTYEPPIFRETQTNRPPDFIPPELEIESEEYKRCPTCKSAYTDTELIFCLTDGTPLDLIIVEPPADNPPVVRLQKENFAVKPIVYARKDAVDPPEIAAKHPSGQ